MADQNPQSGEQQTAPPTEGQQSGEPTEGQSQEPTQQSRTPEDIEAYWKNRQSQEASAAAAREKVLRDQLAAAEARVKEGEVKASAKDAADQTEVERLRALNAELQKQMEQQAAQATAETRKAKYPNAAENLEDNILVSMDEANLAALNEKLKVNVSGGASTGTMLDANQAARPQSGASKPLDEMTSGELKAQLEAQSESFVESLKR